MTVNIFGDRGGYPWIKNASVIKRGKRTKGKLGDYLKEISTSIEIGLTPYQVKTGGFLQLKVLNNKVFADKDVTNNPVTARDYLVIWEPRRLANEPFSWLTTAGPAGPSGKDALSVSRWFPQQLAEWFRENEKCCFYFDNEKDGLVWNKLGKAIGLKNQAKNENNAVAMKKVEKLTKLHRGGYCLEFTNSLYKMRNVTGLATAIPSYAVLVLTFKFMEKPKTREYIVSTKMKERGLTIEGENLQIWGTNNDPLEVTYLLKEWNTVFIQWTCMGDMKGLFSVNNNKGSFTTSKAEHGPQDIFIGAKASEDKFFHGAIAILEVYTVHNPPEAELPMEIRDVLVKDQQERVKDY